MEKLKELIRVFYLSYYFSVVGAYEVIFGNKSPDFSYKSKPIRTNRKKKAVSYLEKLYRK